MRLFRILLFLLFLPVLTAAQENSHDSLAPDTLVAHYTTLSPDYFLTNDSTEFTADLKSFTGFNPLNDLTWSASNGSLGAPYQILWFPEYVDQLHPDFFAFLHRPDEYLFFKENIPVFHDSLPFSVASYSSGYKREQYFDFLHSQPLGKYWRLTLDYRLISAPGAYKNQKASHSGFYATTEYHSKSKVYHLTAGIIFNKVFQQENGGITDANQFVDTSLYDRQLTDVNLLTAQNRFRQNDYFIMNEIRFGGKKNGVHRFYLQHVFNLRREHHVFSDTDPLSGYYTSWNDSVTRDSVAHYAFENTLRVGNRSGSAVRWYLGVFYSDDHLYNAQSDSLLSQKVFQGAVSWRLLPWCRLVVRGSSDIVPLRGGDKDIHFEWQTNDTLDWRPHARVSYCFISPQIFYYRYAGNHVDWSYDWEQTKTLLAVAGLGYKGFDVSAYFATIDHYIYFNSSSMHQGGLANVAGAVISADHEFGRFRIVATGGLQKVANAQYINLPPWFWKAEISMKNHVFKKALTLQSGLGAWMNASYYADAYNPVLQSFYMQREIKTGGFIYPTLFVRAQIKRAVVFVELADFTAGLLKVDYWQIPGYPLPDRAFRFGVTWSFLN